MCYEQKEVRNEVVGEGQGLGPSERGESRANNVGENLYNQPGGAIQVNGLQIPEQQSQGSVIQWERFLPFRSLKVLLVENDDSTRHVVSALLRNCSYEVTAVANGLQAWKILEDLTDHIDLVLTEVSVPFLSGIGLLLKIMSHKTLKNTPVIMMSSHDSMGMVFKCLSKGAVNFLVKPIRKNELQNLWQHIWRRCHSSSGSGSESGTETFKESAKPKSNNDSDNNSGSNGEHDNGSIGLDLRDGSDNGSGTQSSWTKRAAEVESHLPASPCDQLSNAPASTCAQGIHMKPETFSNTWVHVTETKEGQGQDEQLGNSDLQLECQHETKSTHPTNKRRNKQPEVDSKPFDRGELEPACANISSKRMDQSPNDGSAIANSTNPCAEIRAVDGPNGLSNSSQDKNKASCDSGGLPSLELSLKMLRGVDVGTTAYDDRNVLNHSDLSAFSKYNNTSLANQGSTGKVGSCYPLDNNSLAVKLETMHNFQSHSNDTPNQQSNGSSNDHDQGSAKFIPPKQEALNDRLESMSAFKYFQSSPFQHVQSGRISSPQKIIPGKADDVGIDTTKAQAKSSQHQVQVQHHHHYYHHYHHHIHNLQQHQLQPDHDHDDTSLKVTANAPQCESSNVFGVPTEGNAINYSVNGSASGSNHGSNEQNGSIAALNAGRTDIESGNGVAVNSGTSGLSRGINGSGADEDRIAQREAALTKFRQKRKERCFEKRVRYQSRKKLAEQRPRIRGQFVRQKMFDTKVEKDNQGIEHESDDNSCYSTR